MGCDVMLALAAAAAVAALALEYGFYSPPVGLGILHGVQVGVLAAFILDRLIRLTLSRRKRSYLKENWIDFALILAAAGAALGLRQFRPKLLSLAAGYVVITQLYILAVLVLRVVGFRYASPAPGCIPSGC